MPEAGETYLERLNREHRERQERLRPNARPPANIRPRVTTPVPPPEAPAPEQIPDAGNVRAHFWQPFSKHNAVTVEVSADIREILLRSMMRTPVIISIVAKHFGVTREEMICRRRQRRIVTPRHIAVYLTKELTGRSYPEIGRSFGGRDHTSQMSAVRKITRMMSRDPEFAATVEFLKQKILAVCK